MESTLLYVGDSDPSQPDSIALISHPYPVLSAGDGKLDTAQFEKLSSLYVVGVYATWT